MATKTAAPAATTSDERQHLRAQAAEVAEERAIERAAPLTSSSSLALLRVALLWLSAMRPSRKLIDAVAHVGDRPRCA